jgi:phosphoribosyl 1,2-cyclic phosphate phosphodiesterase
MIGCSCSVCTSKDTRNNRLRPSIWLRFGDHSVLLDVSPDFRIQAIRNGLEKIDAILFTHAHADHCLGLDDLRIIIDRNRRQVPVYGSEETLSKLSHIFGYLFTSTIWMSEEPRMKPVVVNGDFDLLGTMIEPLEVLHEHSTVLGFRFGRAAYITDASEIPPSTADKVRNLDLLIINALRYKPHPKHFGLDEALQFIDTVKPKRALLTHMSHEMEYNRLVSELPERVSPAYDGLTVEI